MEEKAVPSEFTICHTLREAGVRAWAVKEIALIAVVWVCSSLLRLTATLAGRQVLPSTFR